MRKFLRAVVIPTLLPVGIIAVFAVIKYAFKSTGLHDKLAVPSVYVLCIAGFMLLLSYGTIGVFENRGVSFEALRKQAKHSRKMAFLTTSLEWMRVVPIVLGALFILYIIAPTSVMIFAVLLAGFLIINSIRFFAAKNGSADHKNSRV